MPSPTRCTSCSRCRSCRRIAPGLVVNTTYHGGDVIQYSGTGTDADDGNLPASAFTWQVDFHHDTHTHPFIPAFSGTTSGTFTIPTTGEVATDVWYRIHLTVKDSTGLTHSVFPRHPSGCRDDHALYKSGGIAGQVRRSAAEHAAQHWARWWA